MTSMYPTIVLCIPTHLNCLTFQTNCAHVSIYIQRTLSIVPFWEDMFGFLGEGTAESKLEMLLYTTPNWYSAFSEACLRKTAQC